VCPCDAQFSGRAIVELLFLAVRGRGREIDRTGLGDARIAWSPYSIVQISGNPSWQNQQKKGAVTIAATTPQI